MSATIPPGVEGLSAWLGGLGINSWSATAEAVDLLADRRQARRRVRMQTVPVAVAAGVVLVAWFVRSVGTGIGHPELFLAFTALLVAYTLGRYELIRRAEVTLGRRLPRRYSRAVSVPARTVLGPWAIVGLVAMVTLQIVMVVALLARPDVPAAVTFAVVCAAADLLAAWLVHRIATRPVLAVDAFSLAVDDRLRTDDAVDACDVVYFAASAFLAFGTAEQFGQQFLIGLAPIYLNLIFTAGESRNRWSITKLYRRRHRQPGARGFRR